MKALLTVVGLSIIGLTILVTYGLCSAFGLFFGPTHNAIPFLFLRIDLLFSLIWKITILNNFENSSHRRKNLEPFEKWGYFQSFWLFWPLFDQILHIIGNEQIKLEYHSCLWHKTTKQPILFSFYEFFSVCAVEKENNLYIGPKLKEDWTNEKFNLFFNC